jgi:hypothetical protein
MRQRRYSALLLSVYGMIALAGCSDNAAPVTQVPGRTASAPCQAATLCRLDPG